MVPRINVWPPLPFEPYARRPPKTLPFPLEEPNCRIFSLGRHGLFAGIKALGLQPGDEVLVPAYHHGSEIEALIRAGIVCRFYEAGQRLEPDEKDLEALLGTRVRALCLTHYLGFPQDAARWRAWCDEHALLLIEDAAQAWLSSRDGTPVGSHADLSIFCLYKTFGLPDGAALISNSPPEPPRCRRGVGIGRVAREHGLYLAQWWGWLAELHRRFKRAGEHDPEQDFVLGDPRGAPYATTSFLLASATNPAAQATRAANYAWLLERLERFVPEPFARLPEGASPFAFPIQSDRKEELLDQLAQRGIAAVNFWAIPHPCLPVADFPWAAALRKSIIALPVHQELGVRELELIVDAVLGSLKVVQTMTAPRVNVDRPARRRISDPLDIAIIEDTQDFAALEGEWEELYQSSPSVTPFQSWAWLYSWWESYGEKYELRLVAIRNAGILVGLIPLMLERRGGFRRLLFIGTGITDHLDVLAREGWEDGVAEAGMKALHQMGFWHVADLQEVRPEAAAWGIFRGWAGSRARVQQSSCPVLDTRPWEELLTRLSKKNRKMARQTLRRAEEDGVRCERVGQDGVEQAGRSWLALHREQWRGRGINPEHLTPRFGSHMLAAAKRMSASGRGGIYEFRRGEEVVASDFVLVGCEYVATYLQGVNEYALRQFQINTLFMWNWTNVALERGIPTVNLLRGEERHKLRWNPKIIPNHRLILGRDRVSFAPYAAYHLLRSRAAEYAKSEDAPTWIEPLSDRLKGFFPK